jgi:hypothetical protein
MYQFLKFVFGMELYMVRKVFLSIIGSLVQYTQQKVYVIQVYADCLLAGSAWNILILLASSQHNLYDIDLLLCILY